MIAKKKYTGQDLKEKREKRPITYKRKIGKSVHLSTAAIEVRQSEIASQVLRENKWQIKIVYPGNHF